MTKILRTNLITISLLIFVAFVNCVPTSGLTNTKQSSDPKSHSITKVKRASNGESSSSSALDHKADGHSSLKSGKAEVSVGTNQAVRPFETKTGPQKRGVNSQLMYGDNFNESPLGSSIPNGVWGDELDPSVLYSDVPDMEEYQRGQFRPKPYDNLQTILNSDMYPEPVALPLQYPYRYYTADRKKRSNLNKYDMRLKRESKLTPADMLALVALVEAGQRSQQEAENAAEPLNDYMRPLGAYNGQSEDEGEWLNSWPDTPYDYYGMPPYNLDTLPRYEVQKNSRIEPNYFPSKRYMITKKKRASGHHLGDGFNYFGGTGGGSIGGGGGGGNVGSSAFDTHYQMSDLYGKANKKYQKYF